MDRCNAHKETGQVVRCQAMKTFIRQQAQLVGDPLWKVERVQASCAWQMKRELDLVAAARAELLLEEQIEVETSDQLVV